MIDICVSFNFFLEILLESNKIYLELLNKEICWECEFEELKKKKNY